MAPSAIWAHPIHVQLWGSVRYWKGSYDEDASGEEDRDIRFFHVLIAIQIALVSLAALLFVNWR